MREDAPNRGKGGLPRRQALVAATIAAALGRTAAAAPPLVVQGSTTFNSELLEPFGSEIAEAAGVTLKVVPNKSNLGLAALMDGAADLAMTSASLSNEWQLLQKAYPAADLAQLQEFLVAQTRAVLIVHPGNPVGVLSDETVQQILSGTIVDWSALGGPDLPIRVVAAREGGGVITTVAAHFLGSGRPVAAPNQIRVPTGPQIVRIVEQEPGALGITDARLARNRRVTELRTGRPIRQSLFLVSRGEPSVPMSAFIAACRTVAEKAGFG